MRSLLPILLLLALPSLRSRAQSNNFVEINEALLSSALPEKGGGYLLSMTDGVIMPHSCATWGGHYLALAGFDGNDSMLWGYRFGQGNLISSVRTADDAVVLVGSSSGVDGTSVVKVDQNGAVVWGRVLKSDSLEFHWIFSATAASDGGVLLTGSAHSKSLHLEHALLVRINRDGFVQWSLRWKADPENTALSAVPLEDGRTVVLGITRTRTPDIARYILVEISSEGTILSSQKLGIEQVSFSATLVPWHNGFLLHSPSGHSASSDCSRDIVVAFDKDGRVRWGKKIRGVEDNTIISLSMAAPDRPAIILAERVDTTATGSLSRQEIVFDNVLTPPTHYYTSVAYLLEEDGSAGPSFLLPRVKGDGYFSGFLLSPSGEIRTFGIRSTWLCPVVLGWHGHLADLPPLSVPSLDLSVLSVTTEPAPLQLPDPVRFFVEDRDICREQLGEEEPGTYNPPPPRRETSGSP